MDQKEMTFSFANKKPPILIAIGTERFFFNAPSERHAKRISTRLPVEIVIIKGRQSRWLSGLSGIFNSLPKINLCNQ
jgi:hypothetical protein